MSRCMVLNSSYEFLTIQERWVDALSLVIAGKATPLEHYPDVVRSQHERFHLPAVVVMRYHVKTQRKRTLFHAPTRRAVFVRGTNCKPAFLRLANAFKILNQVFSFHCPSAPGCPADQEAQRENM